MSEPEPEDDPVRPAEANPRLPLYAGAGGLGLAFFVAERLLANEGQIAATMLSRLSPLMGPIWASYPVIGILLGFMAWFAVKWSRAQTARAEADKIAAKAARAAASAAADLSSKVSSVASGLDGLRSEVHDLRESLQEHAERVEARLRDHDEGLRAVQADVTLIGRRVDVLERPAPRPKRRPA